MIYGCELAAFFPGDTVGEVVVDGGDEGSDTVTGGDGSDGRVVHEGRGHGSHDRSRYR